MGFASRNLLYDSLKQDWERAIEEYGADSEEARNAKALMPSKFINSSQDTAETELKNRIYQKGTRLFGFHQARKCVPPLYIFEGYADCATAYNAGLHNCCAIGATAFTEEHFNMILDIGVDHVICNLDADEAGEKGVDKFVKIVKDNTQIGLKIQILSLPEGMDDPDNFIRKRGLEAFLDVVPVDVFAWELKRSVDAGEDPDTAFGRIMPTIVAEPNNLLRLRMAESLSTATGIRSDVVWAEVQRLVDVEGRKIHTELGMVAARTVKQLERSPDKVEEILLSSTAAIERINTMRQGYDLKNLVDYLDAIMSQAEEKKTDDELKTGWPLFDTAFGGIPRSDAFISIPGKPNQGKSSWLCNIAWRLVDFNDDPIVLYHTVDDSMRWFLPRLLGSKYGIASAYFYYAGKHLAENTMVRVYGETTKRPFREIYADAKKWFRGMVTAERLLPYDASMLDQSVFSLEMRVRDLRKKYTSKPIVVFGDNFHLYTSPGAKEEGEAKTRSMSMACKNLANVHHITLIMTMELPKSALEEGKRPRMMNIKGSAGISYDASANIGIYNDKKDLRNKAELTWWEPVDPFEISPGQVCDKIERPILEMVFDKSKVNGGFDGNIYYRLNEHSGQVLECNTTEQEQYRAKAERQQEWRSNPQPKGAQFGYDSANPPRYDAPGVQAPEPLALVAPSAIAAADEDDPFPS